MKLGSSLNNLLTFPMKFKMSCRESAKILKIINAPSPIYSESEIYICTSTCRSTLSVPTHIYHFQLSGSSQGARHLLSSLHCHILAQQTHFALSLTRNNAA